VRGKRVGKKRIGKKIPARRERKKPPTRKIERGRREEEREKKISTRPWEGQEHPSTALVSVDCGFVLLWFFSLSLHLPLPCSASFADG
jgi:hypothetical protein